MEPGTGGDVRGGGPRRVKHKPLSALILGMLVFFALGIPFAGRASAQAAITCTLQVNNPHQSSHVPGNVAVGATWTCTAPVASLAMDLRLIRNGVQKVAEQPCADAGVSFLPCNTGTTCLPGLYQGIATGTVEFPPGFVPPSGGGTARSNQVPITCL